MRIALFSNVNLDMLLQQLAKEHEVFRPDGYGQWISYALMPNEALRAFDPECIFLMFDGFGITENLNNHEVCKVELSSYAGYIKQLAQHYPTATIAISNIHIRNRKIQSGDFTVSMRNYEAIWDEYCQNLMREMNLAHSFDLRGLIQDCGIACAYDDKMWYMGSIPYSISFIRKLAEAVICFTQKLSLKRKKVLVTDLDNTLWGGVVGEDGALGIVLSESLMGAVYRDTQKLLKQMQENGIILAIVSKNNQEDVREAFEKNSHMYLQETDFSAMRINWDSKTSNIKSIAKELNLGLDSFVFLDDNNVEREAVKQELPEVAVIDFPRDVSKLPEVIRDAYERYFWTWRVTVEDAARTEQYRQEVSRKNALQEAESRSISMADYLRSLDIHITLDTVNDVSIERVVQLLNKTNQFNTNTLRMDMSEMKAYLADPFHQVFTSHVTDKYGDSGLVAVLLVSVASREAVIENFLMSCRVMGRQIENAVIRAVEEHLRNNGIERITASYCATAKNCPVKDLWSKLGYQKVISSNADIDTYQKDLTIPQAATILSAVWN